ncbi:MAG: hypothetical protein QXN01_04260 [Candidatus Anstonellales archaeon]
MMDDVIGIVMGIVALGILTSALMYVGAERESAVEKQMEISYKYIGALQTIEKAKKETYNGRSILLLIADSIAEGENYIILDGAPVYVDTLCKEREINIETNYFPNAKKDGIMFEIELYDGGNGVIWVK